MKKINFYNCKLFLNQHPNTVKLVGSLCGAAIVALSTYGSVNKSAEDDSRIYINNVTNIYDDINNSDSIPLINEVLSSIKLNNSNGETEEYPIHELAYKFVKKDGGYDWVTFSNLNMQFSSDFVKEEKQVGIQKIDATKVKNGEQVYLEKPINEETYLVYNEDGTKEYRSISYLTAYAKEKIENNLQEKSKQYTFTK